MAGFTAENVLNGLVRFCDWDFIEKSKPENVILLDVREDMERLAYKLHNSLDIPLGELRDRLGEIDKTKTIVTYCAIGVRSYKRGAHPHGKTDLKMYYCIPQGRRSIGAPIIRRNSWI